VRAVTLIAEDLLLLLLDDQSGKPKTQQLDIALGGAVLVELAVEGMVEVAEATSVWRSAKVWPVEGARPGDPVLAAAWATVGEKERTAQSLVERLGKGLSARLCGRLAERGILERRDDKVLGVFPRTRWPARDSSSHEGAVRRALATVLVQGQEPDPRTGALVALLHAVDRTHKTVPHEGLADREVKKRAKEVADGQWAAKAVKDAISAATAGTAAAMTAVAAGAVAASG
jgi:Golgi phosphoprotein 3 GPP34